METQRKQELEQDVVNYYKSVGYTFMKDFENEYILMVNPDSMDKVRIYHNSYRVYEYK